MISLLLMALIVGAFYILFKKYRPTSFNSRRHFALIMGYIVFLLAVLLTAEIVEQLHQPLSSTVDFTELNYDLVINESIHSPQFMEKRTHPAGDKLTIQNEYDGAYLYVERKNDDGIIEELIFKPMLLVNKYDFSDKINIEKPIWQDSLITIPPQPFTEIQYAQFYDTVILSQLTGSRYASSNSYATGQPIVHLIVPKNVEIEVSARSSVQYVED